MPFGQSVLVTTITLGLTRRVTFLVNKSLGKSDAEATSIAHDVAITAASVVGTAAAIVTVDPAGFGASAAMLALESEDAENRQRQSP